MQLRDWLLFLAWISYSTVDVLVAKNDKQWQLSNLGTIFTKA